MKLVNLLFVSLLFSAFAHAQKITPAVISNGGHYQKTGSISLEWTLGEFMVETLNGPTNKITQGFHQTNITVVSTSNPGIEGLSVYPNPFIDQIVIENSGPSEILFHLMSIDGKCVESKIFGNGTNLWQLNSIAPGVYLIEATDQSKRQQFVIEKIH